MGHYENFTKGKGVLDTQLSQNNTAKRWLSPKFLPMFVFQIHHFYTIPYYLKYQHLILISLEPI